MQECSSPIRFWSVKPKKFSCNLKVWEVAVLLQRQQEELQRRKGQQKAFG